MTEWILHWESVYLKWILSNKITEINVYFMYCNVTMRYKLHHNLHIYLCVEDNKKFVTKGPNKQN